MKSILVIAMIFLIVGCTNKNQVHVTEMNKSGYPLVWEKFPIPLYFHIDFPQDKRDVVKNEVRELNRILGFEALVILSKNSLSKAKEDGINTISFNGFSYPKGRQALTNIRWQDETIFEVDVDFNAQELSEIDFPTLIRHELSHALGMTHLDHGLMATSLLPKEIKPWDQEVLVLWKVDAGLVSKKTYQNKSLASESNKFVSK